MLKSRFQIIGSLLIAGFILAEQLQIWPSQIVQRLEWIAYDQRVQKSQTFEADPAIIVLDIDELSLQQIGQWPWPREYVAALIESLYEVYDVQLVGFDIVFAERQHSPWLTELANQHPDIAAELGLIEGDQALSDAMARYPVVVAHYFDAQSASLLPSTGQLTPPLTFTHPPEHTIEIPQAARYSANIARLAEHAIGGGFFDNPLTDSDGKFRRAAMLQSWQGDIYPSLSLAMLYSLLGQMPITLDTHATGLEGIDIGGFYIPTDAYGGALVPFYGPRETFTYVSAADILKQTAPKELLQGAIVLVGTSAPGLMDLRTTPVGAVYPGVEIHATLLAAMLAQDIRHEPVYYVALTAIILLIMALVISFLFPYLHAITLISLGLLLSILHISLNWYAWQQQLVLPLASGLFMISTLTLYHLAANLWRENMTKQRVTETFGRYIPPQLVNEIVANPRAQDLTGREAEITVLFSDIRGFTRFSESIPAAKLSMTMNQLLTPLTQAIYEHRGTIDKYMGDAVMAFWGAPLSDSSQALNALRAALAMQNALQKFNHQYGHSLALGIGLHTGRMSVGNMGSEYRVAYTVLGDNVNLGARIEGLTKFYHANILISGDTLYAICAELNIPEPPSSSQVAIDWLSEHSEMECSLRQVDIAQVQGKTEPVTLFEVLYDEQHRNKAISSTQAIQKYQQRDYQTALSMWDSHLQKFSQDKLANIYIQRCKDYIANPPPENWDGIFQHQTK